MKVLLATLNSKYIHSNLALKYLYSSCGDLRSIIDVKEFTINNPDDYIFTEIIMGGYDITAFSCYVWNIEKTFKLIQNLKQASPSLKVIIGGPEVSFECEKLLRKNPDVDVIVSGEGEPIIKTLIESFINGDDVNGIIYSSPANFSDVGFPYEHFEPEKDKILYYESSRGCPYGCSYCLSSVTKNVRELPFERVKKEISYFLDKSVKQVKFIDRTFNSNKKRCSELMEFIVVNDNGITNFHLEICGDLIDDALIDIVKSARRGLFRFEVGVQSTNDDTLVACNRKSDFSYLAKRVKELIGTGKAIVHVDLIAGLPYENYLSFRKSFNDVFELGAEEIQLGFLKLLKGAEITNISGVHGYKYKTHAPYEVISNDYISAFEIAKLKRIENVLNLLHNKGGFSKTLAFAIEYFAETPFDFFESFAEFYYARGFQDRAHKKEDVYRIFLAFADNKGFKAETKNLLDEDMSDTLNFDAVKKFNKKGWDI